MEQHPTPPGFISLDEAIEMIKNEKKSDPKVDITGMANALPWLRENGNFMIKLLAVGTDRQGNKKYINNGNIPVEINGEEDMYRLKFAISNKFKELSGIKDFNPDAVGVSSKTTTCDEDVDPTGKFRKNDKPMTKFGDSTSGGYQDVSE